MATLPVSGLANMGIAALSNYLRFDEFADASEKMGHAIKDINVAAGGTITLVKGPGGNFIEGHTFRLTGAPAAAFTLKVPDGARRFAILNASAKPATIDTVTGSTVTFPVPDQVYRKFRQDGIELAADGDLDIAGSGTVQTIDATQAVLASGAMAADSAHTIRAYGHGREDATGDTYHFEIFAGARNEGGTSSAPTPNVIEVADAGAATWDATFVANDTSDEWEIKVTGEAAHTIDWTVTYSEIVKP